MLESENQIKATSFITELKELFHKYNYIYEIDYDRIVSILDKDSEKIIISSLDLIDGCFSGFYHENENTYIFITSNEEWNRC